MSRLVWFIIGVYSALEGISFLPLTGSLSNILIRFIMNPIAFLAISLFLILSFLILSQGLQKFILVFIQSSNKGNPKLIIYCTVELVFYIIGWVYLFSKNHWASTILFILTMIHLILSFEKLNDSDVKGGI